MKKFAKKAFTLVELLVVIAIIAILAVAGVVGYMAFTKKAEVNNDTSLVAELNNYVSAASATDKINTPTDIRNILVDDGIDLATLKLSAAKQGYVPGFDIVAKKFVLIKDNALVDGYTAAKTSDVFAFAKTEAEANALKAAGFSLYLQSGYDAASIDIAGKGLDVGENTGITTINYTGASSANDVVIRTNSLMCDLTINAANDSVKHYGEAQSINVIAVKSASYHEYGASPFISINTGRIVLEDGAQVEALHVNSSSAILAIASNEQLPTVTIENGVTTFTVQTTQDNNGQVIGTANVTVAAGGAITVSTEISALSGTTTVETKDEEDAKGEAIANSDLVFQVKGSWGEVAANARAVLNDYLRAYSAPTSVLPSSQNYTPEELSDVIADLKDYYVEVGTIHINIDTILLNGVELSSNEVFGLSIGSNRFVRANYFKVENNKLYLPAPVAAFELNTGGSLKINKTNISLGTTVENSLTVKTVHNAKNGTEFSAHEDDAYSFDISKASTTSYTSLAFNEITGSADGPIVTRKLYTYTDGKKQLSYGLSTVDGPSSLGEGNYGIWIYMTGYPVNSTESGTHIDYSLYFMGADKTCALHFDIVD